MRYENHADVLLKTQWAALDDVRNDQCRWQADKSPLQESGEPKVATNAISD
jgi:hypothetical protein